MNNATGGNGEWYSKNEMRLWSRRNSVSLETFVHFVIKYRIQIKRFVRRKTSILCEDSGFVFAFKKVFAFKNSYALNNTS